MENIGIEIYESEDGQVLVRFESETAWLTLNQMTSLFGRDKSVISRHLKNIFESGELDRKSVVAKNATTAADGKIYQVDYYNLDVIISVGYRVNSKQGTQFRIWATQVLRDYLIKGFAINQAKLIKAKTKLMDLQQAVQLVHRVSQQGLESDEVKGILGVLSEYAYALDVLDKYDHHALEISDTTIDNNWQLTYDDAMAQIQLWRQHQNAGSLFGNEKDASFQSSIATIYQSFNDLELYPSIEEKAANLLYFIVKNHSFSDGNKRIAAGIFAYFLKKNGVLFRLDGTKRIADNALVAITIMIAESNPVDKDIITKLIVNLINFKN